MYPLWTINYGVSGLYGAYSIRLNLRVVFFYIQKKHAFGKRGSGQQTIPRNNNIVYLIIDENIGQGEKVVLVGFIKH